MLALELYLGCGLLDDRDERVVELSGLPSKLSLHRDPPDAARFRNPNGVALKLANFAALDPNYPGKGMSRYGKKDEEICGVSIVETRTPLVRQLTRSAQE